MKIGNVHGKGNTKTNKKAPNNYHSQTPSTGP
jgi:hypothetical protein